MDEIQLDDLVNDYVGNPESQFVNLAVALNSQVNPMPFLERLAFVVQNDKHLGYFYSAVERWLEASVYLLRYTKSNKGDLEAWVQLQWIAAQRGDHATSALAIDEICKSSNELEAHRAAAIHNLAFGDFVGARLEAAHVYAINPQDTFSTEVILEVAISAQDWNCIKWLVNKPLGRDKMLKIHPRRINTLRTVVLGALAQLLKARGSNNV